MKGRGRGGRNPPGGRGWGTKKATLLTPPEVSQLESGHLITGGPGCPSIDFLTATNYTYSDAGNTGVFFVKLPGATCVVKGSDQPCSFSCNVALAKHLSIPARIPEVELIAATSTAWHYLKVRLLEMAECTKLGPAVLEQAKVAKKLDRPVLLVMEFMKGCNLAQVASDAYIQKHGSRLHKALSTGVLYAVGRVVALDILLNNSDRVPALPCWVPKMSLLAGNPNNLMLSDEPESLDELILIDLTIQPLEGEYLEEYLQEVRHVAYQSALLQGEEVIAAVDQMAAFFWQHLQVELDRHQRLQLQAGLNDGLQKVAELTLEELEGLRQRSQDEMLPQIYGGAGDEYATPGGLGRRDQTIWEADLGLFDTEFLFSVAKAVREERLVAELARG